MKANSLAKQLSQSSLECHDINEEKESRITSRKGDESTIYKAEQRRALVEEQRLPVVR